MKTRLAKRYFAYVAKAFPVLCASGDIPFLPAAAKAQSYLDRLDDFSSRGVERHIDKLNGFLNGFNKIADANIGLENERAKALATSVRGVLLELSVSESWRKDPSLYLKIAFTGIHHALTLPAKNDRQRTRRAMKRIKAIPSFLEQVGKNIEAVTPMTKATAQTMIRDCARYLQEAGESPILRADPKSGPLLQACLTTLRDFDRHINTRLVVEDSRGAGLGAILEQGFGSDKSIEEIFAAANEEWHSALAGLEQAASDMGETDWRNAYEEYPGPGDREEGTLALFKQEVERLQSFFGKTAFREILPDLPLSLDESPAFMASLRRAAHYCAPLSPTEGGSARLLVIPHAFSGRGFREDTVRLQRARKELVFIAAQETVPGSHLMASRRLLSEDPVITQLRNPLVANGWRAFGEQLLLETGYLETPVEQLMYQRRRLCRAARCVVDAGLAIGTADQDFCMKLMEKSGFSKKESLEQLRAIRLAPGSQVASVLGRQEIEKLRAASGLGTPEFCKAFLDGGETPFSMTALKLKASSH
ncbi:DUF885 family protein [Salidesulfovibrio onnuriiensis]|uniref:DUF885 family protein n=1 Tax=Salidesulfovibrio onnuriiensis TaxID=2583823 RepID=UPI0011C77BFD|nr:DUF885 family protein [Salidesulfovibrio onnuriiensis]